MSQRSLEILSWKEVRQEVQNCSPAVSKALSMIPGIDPLKCVVAQYSFGQALISDGQAFFPTENYLTVNLQDPSVPSQVRELLDYPWTNYPAALLLSKQIDAHFKLGTHLASAKILNPGAWINTSSFLKANVLNLAGESGVDFSVGASSLFMLPKVSHDASNQRMCKKLHLSDSPPPKTLCEQSHLFKKIASSSQFTSPWRASVLIFGNKLMEKIEEHLPTKMVLMSQSLMQLQNHRDFGLLDVLWALFENRRESSATLPPIVMETAKHLILLVLSKLPGFAPAVDESAAPVQEFIRTYLDGYKIRYYMPVFMQPAYFEEGRPIYYSLQKPSFLYPFFVDNNSSRTINVMNGIAEVMSQFREYILSERCPISVERSPLLAALESAQIDYYHPQGEGKIKSGLDQLVSEDPRFTFIFNKLKRENLGFPIYSVFFNGCIRLILRKSLAVQTERPKMREFLSPLKGMRLDRD